MCSYSIQLILLVKSKIRDKLEDIVRSDFKVFEILKEKQIKNKPPKFTINKKLIQAAVHVLENLLPTKK